MKYPPPADPDNHTVQSQHVDVRRLANWVEVTDAVVTGISYRRSSV